MMHGQQNIKFANSGYRRLKISTANLPVSYTSIMIDCKFVAKIYSNLMLCVKVLRVFNGKYTRIKNLGIVTERGG
jgi:hypothetical protein